MGNTAGRSGSASEIEILPDYDETVINRGRVARRKESFCKGLVFSKRPISIDEIVCLRLSEVSTNWSGVLRFGVTNVDPASFRDIELPKFACPDLTSKTGYWAKALAERYSVEGAILHFFVNVAGDMYYGINGVSKGIFLNGINTTLPLWIIIDIYGNSIALEFVDPGDVQIRSIKRNGRRRSPSSSAAVAATATATTAASSAGDVGTSGLAVRSEATSRSTRVSPNRNADRIRFHTVKGINITLHEDDTIALRKHGEYYLGYVFTERPLNIGERLAVIVLATEDAFTGALAFGLTSCDPISVAASRLPIDCDELLERSEYWVCIKDVAATPIIGDKLVFYFDKDGKVFFSKNNAPPRVIMHVDVSVKLWAFFDLYGKTQKIKIIDPIASGSTLSVDDRQRTQRASSEGNAQAEARPVPRSTLGMDSLRPFRCRTPLHPIPDFLSYADANRANDYRQTVAESLAQSLASSLRAYDNLRAGVAAGSTSSTRSVIPDMSVPSRPISMPRLFDGSDRAVGSSRSTALSNELLGLSHASSNPTTSTVRATGAVDTTNNPFAMFLNSVASGTQAAAEALRSTPTSSAALLEPRPRLPDRPAPPLLPKPSTLASRPATSSDPSTSKPSTSSASAQSQQNREPSEERQSECSICMNNAVNSVIYKCGHMCMCYECATEMYRRSGDCPICRTPIVDVIRCYPV
ncbi:Neuralized family protein [Aphelenchoides avenae]|nr:Neuralized family protein [Aphelenchus avenae]